MVVYEISKLVLKLFANSFWKRHVNSLEKDEFTCLLNKNTSQ